MGIVELITITVIVIMWIIATLFVMAGYYALKGRR
jgi:hypothetical protein